MLLRSRRVVIDETVRPAAIEIRDGLIVSILPFESVDIPVIEAAILPGLVDTHVHINEPGRTHWEGFETATRAAAAGGVTTLIEMPLNSIPATTTVAAYHQKIAATEGKLHVDTGFWGGVVPGNTSELEPLWRAGVFGFKCFLVPSGVDEFCHVGEGELRKAMPVLARLGAPLLVHAESPSYLPLRPPESECDAISMMIGLSRETGARVHIVHLAAIEALPLIEEAQAAGVPITVETCPHYVFPWLTPGVITPAREGGDLMHYNLLKCAPPIRGRLRDALPRIGMVVSDHSPSPPEMKSGPYETAWGGIASLELGLSAMATIHDNLADLAKWMAEAPAWLAGLDKKGRIAPGYDADLVLFDPEARWTVDPEKLYQRHKITPYAGRELRGRVLATYLRGEKIYDDGEFAMPRGRVLKR
ncbi:MAG TPA: allantoinase AllB [Bryobacteraceae bacterium]|jgi:allantoinase|nr:allantoinase AllB [Bryobacteraceae bacterium]